MVCNQYCVKNKITLVLADSLHYIYDASFIFSIWREPLTEGERMSLLFLQSRTEEVKEICSLTHVPLENHQFNCLLCKYVAKNERELTRHITFYLKHRQERENKVTDGTFTNDDGYLVIKQDPASWRFTEASTQKSIPVISGSTTTVSTPHPSSTVVIIPTQSPSSTVI